MTPQVWTLVLLSTVAVIYTGTACAYYFSLRPGMALVFVGYMIAQLGLIWDALAHG